MEDNVVLNEIALNEREIEHEKYGKFVIKRPTNKTLSMIETLKTRSINRDLQTKDRVLDPETGDYKLVPAFLTSSSKKKLLKEHGDWTDEDEKLSEEHERNYTEACKKLSEMGFSSTRELTDSIQQVKEALEEILEEKGKKAELGELLDDIVPDTEIKEEPQDSKEYRTKRNKIESALQDLKAAAMLQELDKLHKMYALFIEGAKAQADFMFIKLKEINLLSDTVESRAEVIERVAKVFYCTFSPNTGEKYWKSIDDCEDSDVDLVAWLYAEIEKMERLDFNEETGMDRFNFLFPTPITKEKSDELQEAQKSKPDGAQLEKQEQSSTEASEPQQTN